MELMGINVTNTSTTPPPCAYDILGLEIDSEVFVASKQQVDIVEKYIKEKFPTREDFESCSKFDITSEFLEKLAKNEDYRIRVDVALYANTPVHIQEFLSKDEDYRVRKALAQNNNLDYNLIDILADDIDEDVRWAICKKYKYKFYIFKTNSL